MNDETIPILPQYDSLTSLQIHEINVKVICQVSFECNKINSQSMHKLM